MPGEVGFIGLGRMGMAIARRLRAGGCRLTVHDREPGRAGPSRPGWRVVASPAEVGARCATILLSLPDEAAVESAVSGSDGVVGRARRGTAIVDLGSCDPVATRRLAARLRRRGVELVDAPVSGGVEGARTGDLVVMVGGERAAVRHVLPILRQVGRRVVHLGPAGAGHAMKSLNNYVTAATLLAVWEAVLVAAREGIAPWRAVAVLNGGSARSACSEVKFPRYVLSRRYDSGGTIAHMARDLRIARRLARAAARRGLLAPVAGLWEAAATRHGPADHCLVGREVARRLGLSLPSGLRPRRSPA